MTLRQTAVNCPPLIIPCSRFTTESNKTGSWRFLRPRYENKTAPCSSACPAGEDIPRIEMLVAQGLFKEAWETVLMENPFPGVCGRVCYHPCEQVCNRREFDEPVAIRTVERFLADTATRNGLQPDIKRLNAKQQKIAIVGSGPSGLALAYFLARLGYESEIFEAMPEPGGVLRWGLPTYRLPVAILKADIARILELGVHIHCNKTITPRFLDEVTGHYDAVFLGCGHSHSLPLKIPGEDLDGVEDGLRFLQKLRQGKEVVLNGTAAVIGGGNTAIDVARSAARLGAKPLVIYRRRQQDMPAFDDEVTMALEEGAEIWELRTPVKIAAVEKDYVLTLQQMEVIGEDARGRARIRVQLNKTEEISVQHLFVAIGASSAEQWYKPPPKKSSTMRLSNCSILPRSQGPTVVFGGDLVADIKSVVHAIASGKQAAMALDNLFQNGFDAIRAGIEPNLVGDGPSLSMENYLGWPRTQSSRSVVHHEDLNTDYFRFAPRIIQPRLLREERLRSFAEIDLKIGTILGIREAERCFNCGICNQCDNCRLFCPEIAVVRDDTTQNRRINYDYCKGCGLCVVECPRSAMTLEEECLCNRY
ncbi:MAG: FAD-dependent oxidoreductase [Deltaproteobacteria bacterium]|nr:MAG: FAD-dependent oxidoreductase [Deltaproteobacteria bacterium]